MSIELLVEGRATGQIDREGRSWLVSRARMILRGIDRPRSTLSLVLTDDEHIHALNRTWRHKDRPTDVLSFPQDDPVLLGDVVISLETAWRQRPSHRRLRDEVVFLLIHGVLHLVGHDHHRLGEARRMRAEEERLWLALGYRSAPYAEPL